MLAKERQKKIEKALAESGAVLVSELVDRFGVSIETVRRDLLTMEAEGKLVRVHGGAVVKGDTAPPLSFAERHRAREAEKEMLAKEAAKLVFDGEVIGIDEGSTAIAFAKALKERLRRLTVVTHSLYVFDALEGQPGFHVILLGGSYRPDSRSLVGDLTVQNLHAMHLEKAFIFPSGVSLDFGVSSHSEELLQVQRAMIRSADEAFVLADSSKFEKKALFKLCDMSSPLTFVTDAGLSQELRALYKENGVKVRIGGNSDGAK